MADIRDAIARAAVGLRAPIASDRVYRECAYSFDTPESEHGVYISLQHYGAVGKAYVDLDRERNASSTGNLYLHQIWRRVAKAPSADASDAAPSAVVTKVAIGVPGGFDVGADSQWEWEKAASVAFFAPGVPNAVELRVPDETAALPASLLAVVDAILAHAEAEAAHSTAGWEEEVLPTKYADALIQLENGVSITSDPTTWKCGSCDLRENLWLNLSDAFIGCGRNQVGGAPGNGHALKHYQDTGDIFPLAVKLGTITPSGADVYSYAPDENAGVTNAHLARHLSHWGINIMSMAKTERSTAELELDYNKNHDFGRISEAGKDLVAVTGPGFLGCSNLGNTCYAASTLQVLATLPEVRALYAQPPGRVLRVHRTAQGRPQEDLLSQTVKLFQYLGTEAGAAYALDEKFLNKRPHESDTTKLNAAALSSTGASSADASAMTDTVVTSPSLPLPAIEPGAGAKCGFLTPRLFKGVIGKAHKEFSSNRQQDAAEFVDYLFTQLERAQHSADAKARLPALPDGTTTLADLFNFTSEQRLVDVGSGGVRYSRTTESAWRVNIPLEAATNAREVAAAHATMEELATAADFAGGVGDDAAVCEASAAKRPKLEAGAGKSKVRTPGDRVRAEMRANLPKLHVPFERVLEAVHERASLPHFRSPVTGEVSGAETSVGFASFPRYLFVALNRYTLGSDFSVVKVDAHVPMPLELDLSALASKGLQAGEVDLASITPAAAPGDGATATATGPQPNAELVDNLVGMGFPHGAACRAALATGNSDAEAAMNWILAHMDDAGFDAPYAPPAAATHAPVAGGSSGKPAVDESVLEMLVGAMGFEEKRARYALAQTSNDPERAADWLFSHGEEPLPDEEAAAPASGSGGSSDAAFRSADAAASGKYALVGFISHIGNSTMSGHYVCHIRKQADGSIGDEPGSQWYIFNDEKVARSEDPPFELGYLYFYRRTA